MICTKRQVKEFFKHSPIWTDLKDIFNKGLEGGREELENPALIDPIEISIVRGKIDQMKLCLTLQEIMMDNLDLENIDTEEEDTDA